MKNKLCLFKDVLLITGALSSIEAQAVVPKNKTKPNVLFIIVDDLNDYPGPFGGHTKVKTPNMDKLAKSGITFLNAYCNRPISAPSRNSLFTGVYPHHSKDFGWTKVWEQPVLKNNKTIMEYFAENGYYVMGSGKLLHFNKNVYWNEWGVDINSYGPFAFDGENCVGHPSVPEPFRSTDFFTDGSFAPLSDVPFKGVENAGKRTGWIYSKESGKFLNYVDENNRDLMPDERHAQWAVGKIKELEAKKDKQPFFMGIGFVRPHTPLYAPKRFFDMFPLDKIELSLIKKGDADDTYYKDNFSSDIKGLRYFRKLKEAYGGDAELGLKHFVQAYLACIAFVDEQIGKVVDAINDSKFKDNTIIVLMGDNGWQMGEKDYLFKNSLWEESTRIPIILKAQGFKEGEKVEHPVSLVDIFPTLTDLCELVGDNRKNESGVFIDGFSLKPFLENPNTGKWKGPNGALSVISSEPSKDGVLNQNYSYRTQQWRYILYKDGKEELYNESNDTYEWNNLAYDQKYMPTKNELKNEMLELIKLHSE